MVVDKAVFPRDKCCGDGLTTLALRELELLGFDPAAVGDWQVVDGAVIRSPSGRHVRVPLPPGPGTFAAVAPRLQLDDALVDLAVKAGATVLQGHGFDGTLTEHDDHVLVGLTGHPPIAARYVVAADGMWSPVRKAIGVSPDGYLGEWHAFRQYADGVDGPATNDLFVWFDEDLLPGYAWSFPLPDGRANIGFGVLRDGSRRIQDMKVMWEGLLDRPHIRAALGPNARLEGRHTAWPIPARVDAATLARHRVLLVGDAAMATDVMTGEGIGQALLTGRLAAEAIVAGGRARPDRRRRRLPRRRAPPPRRRPSDVGPTGSRAGPSPGRSGGGGDPRSRRRVEPAQLRPLDVRGRAARRGAHAVALAPSGVGAPGSVRLSPRCRRTRSRVAHVDEQ